jgi:hypothetical protein
MILQCDDRQLRAGLARRRATKVSNYQAVVLHCEIGRGSRVRIGFVRRGSGPVLQAVQILELNIVNPFAGIET